MAGGNQHRSTGCTQRPTAITITWETITQADTGLTLYLKGKTQVEPVPVTQLFGILDAGILESSLNAWLAPKQITARDIIDIIVIRLMIRD